MKKLMTVIFSPIVDNVPVCLCSSRGVLIRH